MSSINTEGSNAGEPEEKPENIIIGSHERILDTEDGQMYLRRVNLLKKFLLKFIQVFFPSFVFLKFFLASIIPAIADQLIPLFYTGQIPNSSSLALAGQFTFITIVLEVIQEGIVNSLFHFVGQNYKRNHQLSLVGLKLCLILLIIFGSIFTIVILCFTSEFIQLIQTPSYIVELTKRFLWFSSFSFPFSLVNSGLLSYFYISQSSWLIVAQVLQVVVSFGINFILFDTEISYGFHWGVNELGFYKILQTGAYLLINLFCFQCLEMFYLNLKSFWWDVPLFSNLKINLKLLFHVSWGNFGDSAVRNFFYFMVTLKFINNLGETEIGAWNLLNTIIWGLLLLPTNSVSNYIKVQIGNESSVEGSRTMRNLLQKIAKESFLCLTAWLVVVGVISAIFWPNLASYFSKSNPLVQDKSTEMFYSIGWIYIIFSFNNGMDSLFYGTGKTEYIFYQSLGTNLIVYFIPWILYETDILFPTYYWVLGLFVGGMLIDFGFTFGFCWILWKKIKSVIIV